jgi:cob(I)alamin adenosyltransferase
MTASSIVTSTRQNNSDLLQKDLSALEKWEEEWQMSFHPQKCTVIPSRSTSCFRLLRNEDIQDSVVPSTP